MASAPYVAPVSGSPVIHRIAGHTSGEHLHGRWNVLCGRIVDGITTSEVAYALGERDCARCAAKASRTFRR